MDTELVMSKFPKSSVEIMICSDGGIWSPQSMLYFSQSSHILVSRHPLEVVEEVLYLYCPNCFTKYSEDDAVEMNHRCRNCQSCKACFGTFVSLIEGEAKSIVNRCSQCGNQAQFSTDTSKDENAFRTLLDTYTMKGRPKLSQRNFQSGSLSESWTLEDLERKLSETASKPQQETDLLHSFRQQLSQQPITVDSVGVRLLSKRTLRCRKDIEGNRFNILVQPQAYPLDGDSSMKLQTGDWWVKDSSAMHFIPFLSVVIKPTIAEYSGQWGQLSVRLRNPRDVASTLRFGSLSPTDQSAGSAIRVDSLGRFVTMSKYPSVITSPPLSSGEPLTINLEAYEDELLREEGVAASAKDVQPVQGGRSGSLGSRDWSCSVDGHTCIVNIPIALMEDISLLDDCDAVEVNLPFVFLPEDGQEITINAKIIIATN